MRILDNCPNCGRPYRYGHVLSGWQPCNCGGHRTTLCRADKDGCGHTDLDPPHNPDTCPPDTGHAPRTGLDFTRPGA